MPTETQLRNAELRRRISERIDGGLLPLALATEITAGYIANELASQARAPTILATLWVALACLMANSSAQAETVDDYVRSEMVKREIPGLSLAVLRDDRVIKTAAYGVAGIELRVPATVDTIYPLASMTKIFSAVALMRLVEEGRITLDEQVTRILPQLPASWDQVTVRECLSHTSGLPDLLTDGINGTTLGGDWDAVLKALGTMPVAKPGEKSVYNQTGYVLLGMIIEKITGMNYEEYMERRLFNPLELTSLSFGDAWAIVPGRTDFYTALDITSDHSKLLVRDGQPVFLHNKILRYSSKFFPDYTAPAGLLNASIRDLVKWEIALFLEKVLKASTLKEMSTPYKLRDGKNGDFGLGFTTGKIGPYATVSYEGGAAAWRLSIPLKHLTVIVLTNLQGSSPETLAAEIARLYDPTIVNASGH